MSEESALEEEIEALKKSANVIVYSRPSGYWYAQAHDAATGARIADASDYSREGVLRALRGKFAMIGVTIKSIVDEDPYDETKARQHRAAGSKTMTNKARLDAEIAEALETKKYASREELVLAAHTAAALVFVGKPTLSDATLRKARSAAFKAIQQRDPMSGTSDHPHAAYSHGISSLAAEGVEQAIAGWQKVKIAGGASGIRRRHGIR